MGGGGKQYYEKVSRYKCYSHQMELELEIDINSELCPLAIGDQLRITLVTNLDDDKQSEHSFYDASFLSINKSITDFYDYIMNGKIYEVRNSFECPNQKCEIYISFGGLLMFISGNPKSLETLDIDSKVYLLIKNKTY